MRAQCPDTQPARLKLHLKIIAWQILQPAFKCILYPFIPCFCFRSNYNKVTVKHKSQQLYGGVEGSILSNGNPGKIRWVRGTSSNYLTVKYCQKSTSATWDVIFKRQFSETNDSNLNLPLNFSTSPIFQRTLCSVSTNATRGQSKEMIGGMILWRYFMYKVN